MVMSSEFRKTLVSNGVLPISGGILTAFSFPDYNLWPLAWIALLPLLISIRHETRLRIVFLRSWIFSVTGFLISLSWVRISMQEYGGVPVWMSLLFLLLLSVSCAVFPSLAMVLSIPARHRYKLPMMATLPVLWVTMEFVRGEFFFKGFPWNSLGLSQFSFLPLLQNADWGSYYGLSFLIVMVNCTLAAILFRSRFWKHQLILTGLLVISALAYGSFKLNQPETGRPFKAAIVQGNIDQHEKWNESSRLKILNDHLALTEQLLHQSPDLLVWSESALTFYFRFAERYEPYGDENCGWRIRDVIRKAGVPLITGTLDRIGDDIFNSAVMVRPEGLDTYYNKEHLVPFGEYIPGGKLLFFVNRLVSNAIGEFATGTFEGPLVYERGAVGMTICYEQIFPKLVRNRVLGGADVICNITNDSWFGRSSAAMQHFSVSCFRAVENRRPVIRAANSGISGAVDSRGRILHRTGLFQQDSFIVTVHTAPEKSIYLIYGDLFAGICIFISIILCIIYFLDKIYCRNSGR